MSPITPGLRPVCRFAPCEEDRRFRVYRHKDGPDKIVGEECTDALGEALVAFPNGLRRASYYFKVEERRLPPRNDNHKRVCLSDRTQRITFGLDPSGP